jgi:hypothetical protein
MRHVALILTRIDLAAIILAVIISILSHRPIHPIVATLMLVGVAGWAVVEGMAHGRADNPARNPRR